VRRFAIWTSVATILTLTVVIWLGLLDTGVRDAGDTLLFDRMLILLHVVLPVSSILMLTLLVKDRHWMGASIFAAAIAGILAMVILRLTGRHLSLGFHLVTDVCALNAYLIVVIWYRSWFTSRRGHAK
jgi:hypothetical protein